MKKHEKIKQLENYKLKIIEMSNVYLSQAGQTNLNNNGFFKCIHDDSGGHPDYHCDQHDNTPGRALKRSLIKNVTN